MRINIIILMILLLSIASSAENNTLSDEVISLGKDLNLARQDMSEMIESGFNILRFNDTLTLAEQIYLAQNILSSTGGKTDYLLVENKIEELKTLKEDAYTAMDELNTLELSINQTEDIDLEPVKEIYNSAKTALLDERYEETITLVEDAYEKISELKSFKEKLDAFSDATSQGIIDHLKAENVVVSLALNKDVQNWQIYLTLTIIIILSLLWAHSKITIFILKIKISHLESRKDSIRELVARTQTEYFESGKISEATYRTRTKKYGELVRDINRQIPLLREEVQMRARKKR